MSTVSHINEFSTEPRARLPWASYRRTTRAPERSSASLMLSTTMPGCVTDTKGVRGAARQHPYWETLGVPVLDGLRDVGRAEAHREGVSSVVCRGIGISGSAQQGEPGDCHGAPRRGLGAANIVFVDDVIGNHNSVGRFSDTDPPVSDSLEPSGVPRRVPLDGTVEVAELDLGGCSFRADVQGERELQQFLRFLPVNLEVEMQAAF